MIRRTLPAMGMTLSSVLFVSAGLAQAAPHLESLADYGSVPAFSLTDHRGEPLTEDQLLGSVWVVDFIFTRCAGQCPRITQQMAKVREAFRDDPHVRLVSVSVDPIHDTPAVLADYARYWTASDTWLFVTGTSPAIRALVETGFHLSIDTGGGPQEPILHSVRLVLVDGQAHIRGYYDGLDDPAVARLIHDVATLRKLP